MVLIHFEVFKPKKTIKLDIPLNTPISNISELIIEHLNLNKNDIPEDTITSLKYLKNGSALDHDKTLESYKITENSKIVIYIPKQITDLISNSNENNEPQKETASPSSNIVLFSNSNTNNSTNSTNNNNSTYNENEPETSEVNYTSILHYVGKKNIKELTDYGFDTIDAAYALAYKPNVNSAFRFLATGLASAPTVRDHINKLVSASFKHDEDEVLRQTIEIAKIESRMSYENEFVFIAALICMHTASKPIQSEPFRAELQAFLAQVQMNFPGQTLVKVNQIAQSEGMCDVQIKSQMMNQANMMSMMGQGPMPWNMNMMNQMQMGMMNQGAMPCNMNMMNQQQMMNQANMMSMMGQGPMPWNMNMMNQMQMGMMNQGVMPNQMGMMNQTQMMNQNPMQFQMNMMNQQIMMNQVNMMNQMQMGMMNQGAMPNQMGMMNQGQMPCNMNMMNQGPMPNQFSTLYDMQFQMMNRMNMFSKMSFLSTEQVKDKFQKIFLDLPMMKPDDYKNPFEETFNDVMSIPHNSNVDFYFQYGKTLNYDQLLFLYQMMISKGIQLNLIIEYLSKSNGDIDLAEELINQNTD